MSHSSLKQNLTLKLNSVGVFYYLYTIFNNGDHVVHLVVSSDHHFESKHPKDDSDKLWFRFGHVV